MLILFDVTLGRFEMVVALYKDSIPTRHYGRPGEAVFDIGRLSFMFANTVRFKAHLASCNVHNHR